MRIAVASSSRLALPVLDQIVDAGHEICGVITTPDAPRGRGRELTASDLALSLSNFHIHKPANDAELEDVLRALTPELVATVAYGRLIKPGALAIPTFGWLNLHFSLLPAFRGAAPVQRAILAGVSTTGVTVFKLDQGMDTGPIYSQSTFELQGNETSGEVLEALSKIGARDVLVSIELIHKGSTPTPQKGSASLAPKISKKETRIDWRSEGALIERMIRAFQPAPGAWTIFRDQRVTITSAHIATGVGAPGAIISSDPLTIATGQGVLVVKKLQSSGRRELTASEWVHGARLSPDDRFE